MLSYDNIFVVLVILFLLSDGQVSSIPDISQRDIVRVIVWNFSFGDFGKNIMVMHSQKDIDMLFLTTIQLIEQSLKIIDLLLTILDKL